MQLHNDVCNEITHPQFVLPHENEFVQRRKNNITSPLFAHVHCIEPMPATAQELQRAASETKYDTHGFVVTHAAMSKDDGYVLFPRGSKMGVENKGISNTGCNSQRSASADCINVTVYSLDTYMETFVPEGVQINYLSIDVEGWDYEVLLGGTRVALSQVHYLEFEYNWVGPWKKQPLKEVIHFLDRNFGFSCYWAGFNNTIWRISNCWLDHYEAHFWSNIACVNRNVEDVQDIANNMENLFMETLEKGDDIVRDYSHRFQRNA